MPKKKIEIEVEESKNGRTYIINGVRCVSVTTPLNILSIPYLEVWKSRVGVKKAEAVSKNAAAMGSILHGYIDKICNGEEPDIAEKYVPIMDLFQEWFDKRVKNIIETEKVVWSKKHLVAGRYDFLGEIEGYDGLSIVDWKTGRIKKEHFLQLSAYRHLTAECDKTIKIEDIKHRLIVNIRDGKITEVPFDKKNPTIDIGMDSDWEVYVALLKVFHWYRGKKHE